MTEETKAEAPAEEAKAPEHMVLVAIFFPGEDRNQNEFKNYVKSCPFSHEGGQTLEWGRDHDRGPYVKVKVQVKAETNEGQLIEWLKSSGVQPWNIMVVLPGGGEGFFLAPAPAPEETKPE